MQIQWYPGHMAKAKRMLREQLKIVDMVIEVLDARIPLSSGNPDLQDLAAGKPRLLVLNKADLAEDKANKDWENYFKEKGYQAIFTASNSRTGIERVLNLAGKIAAEKQRQTKSKSLLPRPIRSVVVGIPNVGKSSLINALVKRKSTRTGNKPGVTKGKQWIRILPHLELLDTPGLLWPKFETVQQGLYLALTGAISDQVYDVIEAAGELLHIVKSEKPEALQARYKLENLAKENSILLEMIGTNYGFLRSGGSVDIEKTALHVIGDFRKGRLGRITLEKIK